MPDTIHDPLDLFFDQMGDLCSVKVQLVEHFPKLVSTAEDPALSELLADYSRNLHLHHREIVDLIQRHDREPCKERCKAIEGLIEVGEAHLCLVSEPGTQDLMVIAHVLRILAHENAALEITSRMAGQLDLAEDAGVLLELQQATGRVIEDILALQPRIFEGAFRHP